MGIKQSLEKSLTKFGKNNSPTLVAMGIATAKGVFRPTFTMMDKKENYETKFYIAMREGLTELIAIPIYFLSGVLSKNISKKLAVTKNFVPKDVYKKYQAGDTTPEIKNAIKHAEDLAKENLPKLMTNTAFIGVCLSALLVIPLICSITIKPIMSALEKRNAAKKNMTETPPQIQKSPINKTSFKALYPYNSSYGMKVGSL